MDSARLPLALAATRDWNAHHLDVKSAFLNGELTEMGVCAAATWVRRCRRRRQDSTLVTLEFKKCASEHALYTRRSKEGILIVGVYVDDSIITGSEQQEIGRQGKHAIELCQSAYALKLLERAGLKGCNPTQVPMQEKPKLSKNSADEKVDATLYRSLIGGLRYLTHTRPDISFCGIWSCELGLAYPRRKKISDLHLIGFSDSDMGGDLDGRKSTSGMVFFLETCPISWQSQKQKIVALSTCEAEYIAGAAAACQGVWLRRLLEEITGQIVAAPILRIDNHSAIELAKNPVLHSHSKHNDIKFHFIRDCVEKRQVILEQVGTSQQLADVFTKPLGLRR
ncbi:hypothetical protein U9M48_019363 [Paspalum notatum var. saurae]|uniref:Reverse transcriptase Ty1/copia-type domain-containing protein n=1 Tax=Paspalum notatum var. saurae TaxID=547442 RepID=A0AAQ3WR65_PASNO